MTLPLEFFGVWAVGAVVWSFMLTMMAFRHGIEDEKTFWAIAGAIVVFWPIIFILAVLLAPAGLGGGAAYLVYKKGRQP